MSEQITFGYRRTNAPCKNCQDRYIGCHGKCEKYLEYREWGDKIKDKAIKDLTVLPFDDRYKGAGKDLRKRSSRSNKY